MHDASRILVVDDRPENLFLLERILDTAGFTAVETIQDPTEVLPLWDSLQPDILLLDLTMPVLDGFAVLEQLAPKIAEAGDYFPILLLTSDRTPEIRQRAVAMGVSDFLTKPFDHVEVALRIRNLLATRSLHRALEDHHATLEGTARDRTEEFWGAVNELEHSRNELRLAREAAVKRLSITAEYRVEGSAQHIERMSRYCALLGRLAGWDDERVQMFSLASRMHDVGKTGLPDNILLKKSILTHQEQKIMESHTTIGYEILNGSDSELIRVAASIAHTHHERVDGSGYPQGLRGEEIPIEGRMVAIADVYDALTTERPYRRAMSFVDSFNLLRAGSGTQFDAELLDLFLDSIDEVLKIREDEEGSEGERSSMEA